MRRRSRSRRRLTVAGPWVSLVSLLVATTSLPAAAESSPSYQEACGQWLRDTGLGRFHPEWLAEAGCAAGTAGGEGVRRMLMQAPLAGALPNPQHFAGVCEEALGREDGLPQEFGQCFPSVAKLTRDDGAICSGALVAPGIVLTARHCLPVVEASFELGRVTHRLGEPRTQHVRYAITRALKHPERRRDIALVQLQDAPPLPTFIWRTRREQTPEMLRLYKPSLTVSWPRMPGTLFIPGYGLNQDWNQAGRKSYAVQNPVERWGCTGRSGFHCRDGEEMILLPDTAGANDSDTGPGDSGAPALEYLGPLNERGRGSSQGGWRLVGITSRSLDRAGRSMGDGGVYQRVDSFSDWLVEAIRRLWLR